MTRLLVLAIALAGPLGCTSESARTELLDRAHEASQQIDDGATTGFPADVTQLIAQASQLRTDPETTTDFLATGVSASIEVDHGDKVLFTTPVLQLLDAATQLAH